MIRKSNFKFYISDEPISITFNTVLAANAIFKSPGDAPHIKYKLSNIMPINGITNIYMNSVFNTWVKTQLNNVINNGPYLEPFIQFYDKNGNRLYDNYVLAPKLFNNIIRIPENAISYQIQIPGNYFGYEKGDSDFFILSMVEPVINYNKLSLKKSKAENEAYYRTSMSGDIKFHGKTFEKISQMTITQKGMFLMCDNEDKVAYYQQYTKLDFEIDYYKKIAKFKLNIKDEYSDLLSKIDKTFNITKLGANVIHTSIPQYPFIQAYIKGGGVISNYIGGESFDSEILSDAIDSFRELSEKYIFEYVQSVQSIELISASGSVYGGTYAGVNGEYYNVNGCKMRIVGTEASSFSNNIRIYSPSGDLYALIIGLKIYEPADFSNVDYNTMWQHYPQCRYIAQDISQFPIYSYGSTPGQAIGPVIKDLHIGRHHVDHVFMRLLANTSVTITPDNTLQQMYRIPEDDFAYQGRNYNFACKYSATIYSSVSSSKEPTEYGIMENGLYYTDSNFADKVFPLCKDLWGLSSYWYKYSDWTLQLLTKSHNANVIKDAYELCSVIQQLLNKMNIPLTHDINDSEFLYGPHDTITGLEKWHNICITPITNVLRSDHDVSAQKGDISLEMIFKMLSSVFNCYYYIEDGHLKIEHELYFLQGKSYSTFELEPQLDLTKEEDRFNLQTYSYDQQVITFESSLVKKDITLSYAYDGLRLYSSIKQTAKNAPYTESEASNNISIGDFVADMQNMMARPDSYSQDAFALLLPDAKGTSIYPNQYIPKTVTIYDDNNKPYKVIAVNYYASLYNIIRYHQTSLSSLVNSNDFGISIPVIPKLAKMMKHTVRLPEGLKIKLDKGINTFIGIGEIYEISIDIDTCMADVVLRYNPE